MLFLFLILIAFLSLLPNLGAYPFKNEESLRVAVAFEMWHSKSYTQPTFLGEPYYNKPPLFNWLIILYSHIFPWEELTGRVVSLTFLLFTSLLVGLFSYRLFRNVRLSLSSSFIFLTFGNVLFFYGYLAEIDMTFSFFVYLGIFLLYLWWEKRSLTVAILSGVAFGASALLKGFPAYAFIFLSHLDLSIYHRSLSLLWSGGAFISYAISLLLPLLWLSQVPVRESFGRVEGDFSRFIHMLLYPLVNFKDLLPWSLVFFFSLYFTRLSLPPQLRPLLLMFFLNYTPYWISNSAGRYIMPLYPLLAIIFSFYINQALQDKTFKRVFLSVALSTVFLRILYGFAFFP
ncbi:MAG: glycosyltransferase family 39 protein, partial [Aquificaceae bacterium]|nr:glycosyltransferase family 39 protein [Aquificaceae bacterium]